MNAQPNEKEFKKHWEDNSEEILRLAKEEVFTHDRLGWIRANEDALRRLGITCLLDELYPPVPRDERAPLSLKEKIREQAEQEVSRIIDSWYPVE